MQGTVHTITIYLTQCNWSIHMKNCQCKQCESQGSQLTYGLVGHFIRGLWTGEHSEHYTQKVQDGHQGIRANHSNFLKQDRDT